MIDIPVAWALPQVISFILVVARLSGLFLVAPIFSSPQIPPRLKMMMLLAVAVTLTPVVPAAAAGVEAPANILLLVILVAQESIVGFAIGFAVSLIFVAIQVAASFIDLGMGLAMANMVDPVTKTQGAVMGAFYSIMASLVFLSINGHHWILTAFKSSYELVPLGQPAPVHDLLTNIFATFSTLFAMAFQLAAPVLITLLMCDVVLGIVSRVVPQMNVFFVGVPLKIAVGLMAIIIALPNLTTFMEARIGDVLDGAGVLASSETSRSGEVTR